MPIPEDTVTTHFGSASLPAPTLGDRSDSDAQTEKQAWRSSPEWEEPHPGHRYAYTPPGNVRPGAGNCNSSCNGGSKVGMAAKSYAPYPLPAPRRFARPRVRTPASRGHKTPSNNTHENRRLRLSFHATHSNSSSLAPMLDSHTPSMTRIHLSPPGNPIMRRAGASADNVVLSASESSSLQLSMTDFSGFLKTPSVTTTTATPVIIHAPVLQPDSDDGSSCMSLDAPDVHVTADEDPYGWDAELNRRLTHHHSNGDSGDECCAPPLQYRRAGGAKRSLLQRVLSLGPREPMRSGM